MNVFFDGNSPQDKLDVQRYSGICLDCGFEWISLPEQRECPQCGSGNCDVTEETDIGGEG